MSFEGHVSEHRSGDTWFVQAGRSGTLTSKRVPAVAIVLIVMGLTSCNKPEPYANVSEDQLNHYAGIETHDHPVDNAATPVDNGLAPAPEDQP